MKQKFEHGIVRDEQVYFPIAIAVGQCDTEAFSRFREADFFSYFSKVSIAVVMINERRNWFEIIRVAIRAVTFAMFAAPNIVEIPL